MTERKFYKTIVTTTIFSDMPYEEHDLCNIESDRQEGTIMSSSDLTSSTPIDGKEFAAQCEPHGHDLDWYNLTPEGEDLEDDDGNTIEREGDNNE